MFGATASPGTNDRPHASSSASVPNIHMRSPSRHIASPFNHHASTSSVDRIPALPVHGSAAPSNNTQGAFATGYSPVRGNQPAHNGGTPAGTPVTPSKKRVFNYASPSAKGHRSSPSRGMAASPGNFNLKYSSGTTIGGGYEDMLSDRYSQSPIGKESQRVLVSPRKPTRWVSKTPFKVLDAPELAVSLFKKHLPYVSHFRFYRRMISTLT